MVAPTQAHVDPHTVSCWCLSPGRVVDCARYSSWRCGGSRHLLFSAQRRRWTLRTLRVRCILLLAIGSFGFLGPPRRYDKVLRYRRPLRLCQARVQCAASSRSWFLCAGRSGLPSVSSRRPCVTLLAHLGDARPVNHGWTWKRPLLAVPSLERLVAGVFKATTQTEL